MTSLTGSAGERNHATPEKCREEARRRREPFNHLLEPEVRIQLRP
jgi:hypothetical protein